MVIAIVLNTITNAIAIVIMVCVFEGWAAAELDPAESVLRALHDCHRHHRRFCAIRERC